MNGSKVAVAKAKNLGKKEEKRDFSRKKNTHNKKQCKSLRESTGQREKKKNFT